MPAAAAGMRAPADRMALGMAAGTARQ